VQYGNHGGEAKMRAMGSEEWRVFSSVSLIFSVEKVARVQELPQEFPERKKEEEINSRIGFQKSCE